MRLIPYRHAEYIYWMGNTCLNFTSEPQLYLDFFLRKCLLALGCIGQERPVITVTTSLKPFAVGQSFTKWSHKVSLINTPRAISEPLRMSHIFSHQCHWAVVCTWLSSFCFLPPWLSGGCLHPPENIHGSLSSLLLLLSSPLAFYY